MALPIEFLELPDPLARAHWLGLDHIQTIYHATNLTAKGGEVFGQHSVVRHDVILSNRHRQHAAGSPIGYVRQQGYGLGA